MGGGERKGGPSSRRAAVADMKFSSYCIIFIREMSILGSPSEEEDTCTGHERKRKEEG